MAPRVLVYGAGGHGKVVADVARSAGFEVVGFVDDDPERQRSGLWGLRVLSWDGLLAEIATLLHPSAVVAPTARVGAGSVVHRSVPDGRTVVGTPARSVPPILARKAN